MRVFRKLVASLVRRRLQSPKCFSTLIQKDTNTSSFPRAARQTLPPPTRRHVASLHPKTLSEDISQNSDSDTIYALSTASGRAGIAIVRISGPSCLNVYHALCPGKPVPKPRYASLRTLYDPTELGVGVLDSDALVLYFPAPKTVTGEEMLELHVHGGPATVKAVLSGIARSPSKMRIRYAEPGEFTRRAFQNDRLDLAQVEALSDTLSAETEQQRRAAVRGNSGALGKTYESWRHQLLYARGELEALIDFSEDQHFDESPAELLKNVSAQVSDMLNSITVHEVASHRGELIRKGIRISLLGPPNAGKSSLLNRIVGREASIVSSEAGTTRDIVEVSLDIRGYLCSFADTAGLRSSIVPSSTNGLAGSPDIVGDIEKEGIRRAKARAGESDMIIVVASIEPSTDGTDWKINYDDEALEIASKAETSLIIVNKCDVVTQSTLKQLLESFKHTVSATNAESPIPISCKFSEDTTSMGGGNIDVFLDRLISSFKTLTRVPDESADLLGVTERQGQLLQACRQHLLDFTEEANVSDESEGDCDIVVAAEHLRFAANCLSRITGRGDVGDVEDVLGVVFEKFCVGK